MANPLKDTEIEELLEDLDGWSFGNDKISKSFKLSDFKEALSFLVRVGFEAEDQGHHPEIFNVYNNVKISLQTHDAGDKVTQKDIDLAKAIERI
ncbi:4a-hydroxytetrahydrobiopterin dehydratase [Balneola sp. MJW-20]|uniref:4a-hydroxytetrahydrobiopterin dehydratase n=1 Tax=Gracilimonas aurantiaca TaxID=3234185 RepID=UPI0034678B73